MKKLGNGIKLGIGLAVGVGFLVWTLWDVKYAEIASGFSKMNYLYLLPMLALVFISHWLRALRWQFLLEPVKSTKMKNLFSSLIIGYMMNIFMPAHLGEFVRAYLIGKKESMPSSLTFSTIAVERVIDMLFLILLFGLSAILSPFHDEKIRNSGKYFAILTFGGLIFLIFLKLNPEKALKFIDFLITPFSDHFKHKFHEMIHSFLAGLNPLKHWSHYIWVSILSVIIWLCYGLILYLGFFAFDFHLSIRAALALLAITTVAVAIPSSPGYIGTYHKLCVIGLALFNISENNAIPYAFVLHGLNFFPILLVGLFFAFREGLSFASLSSKEKIQESVGHE